MDSLKTKITNAAQVSGYKTVTYTAAAGTDSDASIIYIPKGARVCNVNVLVQTAWDHGTSAYVHAGYPAGVAQSDTSSSVSADRDAFLAGNNNLKTAENFITSKTSATKPTCLMDVVPMANAETYSTSGEYLVPVTLEIATAGNAGTAGQLVWWVEYMFPANIVWTQADLS